MSVPGVEKPRMSISALSTLQGCGTQYEFRYVKRLTTPDRTPLIRGRAIDAGVNLNLRSIIDHGKPASVEDIISRVTLEVNNGFAGGIGMDEDEAALGHEAVKKQILVMSTTLALYHQAVVAPTYKPVAVQKKIIIRTEERMRHDLVGVIDVEDDAGRVRDTKSARKSPPEDVVHTSDQLTMYAMLKWAETGKLPSAVVLDTLIMTPGGKKNPPKVYHVTQESTRTEEDVQRLMRRLRIAEVIIAAGIFAPVDPKAWWCSKDWCGYHNLCPYVRHDKEE